MELEGLHKSQLAALGRILGASGIDPSAFQWQEAPYDFAGYTGAPALTHKPTGFWFGIARNIEQSRYSARLEEQGRRVAFAPGKEREVDEYGRLTWPDVENHFRDWLTYLRRELDAPDFWDAVRDVSQLRLSVDDADKPFTHEEQSIVATRLSAIEQRLEGIEGITREQAAVVREEFQELSDQLSKMKKGQWFKLFVGTLVSLGLRKIVTPEVLRRIADFAQTLLSLLGSLPRLPPF